jgi:hypothetical protein
MDFTINVTGRSLKPRIINVKQYSNKADRVIFTPDSMPYDNATCYVISKACKQSVAYEDNRIIWDIDSSFTAKSGTFDIQLEISDGEKIWLSDVMLLIVSESVSASASTTVSPATVEGCHLVYEQLSVCTDPFKNKSAASRIFTGGTIFNYEGD